MECKPFNIHETLHLDSPFSRKGVVDVISLLQGNTTLPALMLPAPFVDCILSFFLIRTVSPG